MVASLRACRLGGPREEVSQRSFHLTLGSPVPLQPGERAGWGEAGRGVQRQRPEHHPSLQALSSTALPHSSPVGQGSGAQRIPGGDTGVLGDSLHQLPSPGDPDNTLQAPPLWLVGWGAFREHVDTQLGVSLPGRGVSPLQVPSGLTSPRWPAGSRPTGWGRATQGHSQRSRTQQSHSLGTSSSHLKNGLLWASN